MKIFRLVVSALLLLRSPAMAVEYKGYSIDKQPGNPGCKKYRKWKFSLNDFQCSQLTVKTDIFHIVILLYRYLSSCTK